MFAFRTLHYSQRTLTANIRERRGSKVCINVPIFKDANTPSPFLEKCPEQVKALGPKELDELKGWSNSHGESIPNSPSLVNLQDVVADAKPDHVYLDCMCFGMGCCCLQMTFQSCSIEEARQLYDQLCVLSPVMLALSAAAPIYKGFLTDVDCRWNIISASVDDRTREERGEVPLSKNRFRIKKSRYASISTYLSPGPLYSGGCCGGVDIVSENGVKSRKLRHDYYKDQYNDIDIAFDEEIYEKLIENGVDHLLARHYAHLFIRDPLVIYRELLHQDDVTSSDHFENIQSTNWQTMRFKPPPPNMPNMGWRVEFRSMEVQRTDFENAAFSVFVVLVTRTILSLGLNLYIPLSKVDDNMTTAQKRDAAIKERFWFRSSLREDSSDEYSQMTCDEIINGTSSFEGLANLVREYIQKMGVDLDVYDKLNAYVNEISDRASGKKKTNAREMRDLVLSHPEYKKDSVVNDHINYDIAKWYGEFN